jgi:hypothetical protein
MIDEDQGSPVLHVAISVTSWACVSCGQANPGHGTISIAIAYMHTVRGD